MSLPGCSKASTPIDEDAKISPQAQFGSSASISSIERRSSMRQKSKKLYSWGRKVSRFHCYSSPDPEELTKKKCSSVVGSVENKRKKSTLSVGKESRKKTVSFTDDVKSKKRRSSSLGDVELKRSKLSSSPVIELNSGKTMSSEDVESRENQILSPDIVEPTSRELLLLDAAESQKKKSSLSGIAESRKKKFSSSQIVEKSKSNSLNDRDEMGNWPEIRYRWEETIHRMKTIEAIRDAPPCAQDIQSVLEKPLFPQVLPPEDAEDWPYEDTEKHQDPETQRLSSNRENNNEIFGTESDDSEEPHVRRPVKTYERKVSLLSKGLVEISPPRYSFFPSHEAERLWDKHFAAEAKERCQRLRALQQRRIIRNPATIKEFQEAAAASKAIGARIKKKPTRMKKNKEEQTPSPRTATIRIEKLFSADGPTYTVIDNDGHSGDDLYYDGATKENPTKTRTRGKESLPPKKMVPRSARNSLKIFMSSSTSENEDQSHRGIDESRNDMAEAPAGRRRLPFAKMVRGSKKASAKAAVISSSSSSSEDDYQSQRDIDLSRDVMAETRAMSKKRLPRKKKVRGSKKASAKAAVISSSSSSEDDYQSQRDIDLGRDVMAETRAMSKERLPLTKMVLGIKDISAETVATASTSSSRSSRPTVTSIGTFEKPILKLITKDGDERKKYMYI